MDLNAEFSYHMGGALYIPQRRAPSPEQVPSSAVALPESVPSSSATTDMSPPNTPNPIPSVTVKDGGILEESDQSSLDTDEDDGSTGSAEYSRVDSEPLSEEPSRPLKRSHQEEEYSSEQETSNAVTCSNKQPRKSKRNKNWDQRIEELKEFKAKHGHCRLTTSCGSLYGWLNYQRNSCLNPNSPSCLKDVSERERRTKELESVLGKSLLDGRLPRSTTEASKWDQRLQELKEFKAKNGHCRLPRSCGSLYEWLFNQRNIYLNPNSPRYLKDVSERERRTKELESVLDTNLGDWRSQTRTKEARTWDARIEELKKFKAEHGHCFF